MKTSKYSYLFGAACISLIALMAFQVNWLMDSREMIEAQFDQKVNLALGSAISFYNQAYTADLVVDDINYCIEEDSRIYINSKNETISVYDLSEINEILANHLRAYEIDMAYEVYLFDEKDPEKKGKQFYQKSFAPGLSDETNYLIAVSFPGKDRFVLSRMKYMSISSVLILLFLSTVFILIWRALLHQRKISENNIDFFNNTAHELKTPLTNITLAMNLMTKKNPVLDENRYVQIAKKEGGKLMNQIERVLYLSKMESGEYDLEKSSIDLRKIIKEVVQDMQIIIEAREAVINIEANDSEFIIKGDKYHLANVFRNLIDNALKYCRDKPAINIRIKSEPEGIFLHFKDNGIGISKMDQQLIFRKFQRVNTGNVHNQKGFGIGLSYVKTVVEMHRGFIRIFSDLNKGSQFDLFIPHG